MVGDLVNDKVFRLFKHRYPNITGFRTRAIVSSVCGSTVDSTLFVTVAFMFEMPVPEMIAMILLNVSMKTIYEIIILPITYRVAKFVSDKEEKFSLSVSE